MFALRLAVLVPLYLAGVSHLGWLVTLRLVLGWPLFAVVVWLSWIVIRRATRVTDDAMVEAEPTTDTLER